MSIIGTGIAAGVAATAQQAQQVNKRRKRAETESQDDARRIRDEVESHLLALDEGDTSNSATQLRIYEKIPDHAHSPAANNEPNSGLAAGLTDERTSGPIDYFASTPPRAPSAQTDTPGNQSPDTTITNIAQVASATEADQARSEDQAPRQAANPDSSTPSNTEQPPPSGQLYRHVDITA